MNEVETALLIYCIATSLAGHVWLALRIQDRRKHYRRSKSAKKAAETRRLKKELPVVGAGRSPWAGPPPAPPKKTPRMMPVGEAPWLVPEEEEEEEEEAPEYNEMSAKDAWHPKVTRIDGTAKEYSEYLHGNGSVQE